MYTVLQHDYKTLSMQVNRNNGRCQADPLDTCASNNFCTKNILYKNM